METIENTFSDNQGNHLMVALDFYDNEYKHQILQIPEELNNFEIVDINIGKVFVDKPIHYSVFFNMCSWLEMQFNANDNAIFTYICSIEELETNHNDFEPQMYRWTLFDKLFQRSSFRLNINTQDIIVGPTGFQSFGRAFYRDKHTPIIHIVASYLKEKQQL